MSLSFICVQCSRQLHNYRNLPVRLSRLCVVMQPLIRSSPMQGIMVRVPSEWHHNAALTTGCESPNEMSSHHCPKWISHNAEYKPSVEHSPNIFLNFNIETSSSCLEFGSSLNIMEVLDVIANCLDVLSPRDLCIAINKLWECIWNVRDNVDLWLKYSKVLHNHIVLQEVCALIKDRVESLSNGEALNTLYLLLKFGIPTVTVEAIAALYHSLSLRLPSFNLSDAAMFVRCSQSVKDVIHMYRTDSDASEGSIILKNTLSYVKDLLINNSECQPEAMTRLLLGLLHCSVEVTNPVVCHIVQKLHSAISELDSSHLSPLSKAIFMMNRQNSQLAGHMTSRFSEILDDLTSPSNFSHMFFTHVTLCSEELEKRLADAFHRLYVKGASYGFNDLRRVMQGAVLMRSRSNRDRIMIRAGWLLIPQVPAIPPIELAIIYTTLRKVYSQNFELRGLLEHQMKRYLSTCEAPHHLLALIEVLSHDPSPEIKMQLVDKATEIVPQLSTERLGRLCNAAGRMKVRSGKLAFAIEAHVAENVYQITELTAIKNISHYLASARSNNIQCNAILTEKLHKVLTEAIQPSILVFALDALSNLGPDSCDINPIIWDKVLACLPRLNGNDLRRVFFILSAHSNHLHPSSPDTPRSLQCLLECVRKPLFSSIYLNKLGQGHDTSQPVDKHSSNHPDHFLNPSWVHDASSAIAFCKLLTQHRIYNRYFLVAIESVIKSTMEEISPFHIRDILEAFSCGGYEPLHPEVLDDLCTKRVIPYMSDLQHHKLVSIALNLAALQCFPVQLLHTIFSLNFLQLMEKVHVSRSLSDQLQALNRAVCLECPEMRVPWFSQESSTRRGRSSSSGLKLDVELVLHDILGGSTFLQKNIQTPYDYIVDFECLSNSHGDPVEYGTHNTAPRNEISKPGGGALPVINAMGRNRPEWKQRQDSPHDIQRIALDIIHPSQMCSNVTRVSSWVEMKQRHLEILGYVYITIPYTDWSRDILTSFQAKRLYLSELLSGCLSLHVEETSPGRGAGRGTGRRGDDLVERMLEEWGEDDK